MSEEKTQCPYKIKKYRCRYGKDCTGTEHRSKGEMNDCSVARRHYAGCPWRTEIQIHRKSDGGILGIFEIKEKVEATAP